MTGFNLTYLQPDPSLQSNDVESWLMDMLASVDRSIETNLPIIVVVFIPVKLITSELVQRLNTSCRDFKDKLPNGDHMYVMVSLVHDYIPKSELLVVARQLAEATAMTMNQFLDDDDDDWCDDSDDEYILDDSIPKNRTLH